LTVNALSNDASRLARTRIWKYSKLKENNVTQLRNFPGQTQKLSAGFPGLLFLCLFVLAVAPVSAQSRPKVETIEATASGTDFQAGQLVTITFSIYEYSPLSDQQILNDAFQKGKDQGLFNALSKMRAVGHIAVTGTIGYDVSYIRMIPTPNGRKIRFITNRLLRFGEVYWDTRSESYNLTAGELDLNDEDKSKSTGVLYPAAQLVVNKDGELQMNLIGSPWKLVSIIDWKGTPGVN
jgi:hypothetical protein